MEKINIQKYLKSQKAYDYTYVIAFFLIFSFFAFVLIRPNLIEIFTSHEKIIQMKKVEQFYAAEIKKILTLQKNLEQIIDQTYLLDEALSTKPQINKVLEDYSTATTLFNLTVDRIDLDDINLKVSGEATKLKSFQLSTQVKGGFDELSALVKELSNQRRLKRIQTLSIKKDLKEASSSPRLNSEMSIEGFYL